MSSSGSVTAWIGQLKAGEETALAKLHVRYVPLLEQLARRKLAGAGAPRRAADEQDVVQEAFFAFYRTLRAGRLPQLVNRGDLWALLTTITARRVVNQIHHEQGVLKRRADRVQGDSVLEGLADDPGVTPLEQAELSDLYRFVLNALPESLRQCAELWAAGYSRQEMAAALNCVERTVQRKIDLVLNRCRKLAANMEE